MGRFAQLSRIIRKNDFRIEPKLRWNLFDSRHPSGFLRRHGRWRVIPLFVKQHVRGNRVRKPGEAASQSALLMLLNYLRFKTNVAVVVDKAAYAFDCPDESLIRALKHEFEKRSSGDVSMILIPGAVVLIEAVDFKVSAESDSVTMEKIVCERDAASRAITANKPKGVPGLRTADRHADKLRGNFDRFGIGLYDVHIFKVSGFAQLRSQRC